MFTRPDGDVFVPGGEGEGAAFERVTHMGVGAHQDDLEIMALDGVLKCFGRRDAGFMGVVVTDGSGSPRHGIYGGYSDEQMRAVRKAEQRKAALIGEYAACVQLMHPSADVKNGSPDVLTDLVNIFEQARPEVVYTHNLADKHDTHVATALRVIAAIRMLPPDRRPKELYGGEVWRGLDWMQDADKVVFNVGSSPNISAALLAVFDSQITGGKRYDLAAAGRRLANATFLASHFVDNAAEAAYAMDLTPLVTDDTLDPAAFAASHIDRFRDDVLSRLTKFGR